MKALTTKQKKYLRALTHDLKPVVYVGQQGFSDSVLKDAERALEDHELIKVRFIDYKDEKKALSEKIVSSNRGCASGNKGSSCLLFPPLAGCAQKENSAAE